MQEVVVTPSGYKFTIKSELNYGEFQEVRKVYARYMKFDAQTGEVAQVPGEASIEVSMKGIEILVLSGVDPEGNDILDIKSAINGLPVPDAFPVVARVDEILASSLAGAKKGA